MEEIFSPSIFYIRLRSGIPECPSNQPLLPIETPVALGGIKNSIGVLGRVATTPMCRFLAAFP